jgi:anaerobic selenocysteine-containing dehydrogenase
MAVKPPTQTTGICRFCHAACGLEVTIEHGRVTHLIGDLENPMYAGFSCVKGRNYHLLHEAPDRVLHPLRRSSTGALERVGSTQAIAEVAGRLQAILAAHGPRSVALYGGTFSQFCPAGVMLRDAFMDAIGSPMRFTNATIDQPGKPIAMALHGRWGAGPQAFADADVCMLVGANTLLSMWGGIPAFNPAKRLHEARQRGLKLIVIDPRRSETARKADLHLQCLPGHDAALIASIIHVILRDALQDAEFVKRETEGVEALRTGVADFTPERVARMAGVAPGEIEAAARMFALARRGNASSGTGPSMAPHGVLMEYLLLALNSLCGRWPRAGEPMPNRGVLFRAHSGIARTEKLRPAAGFGEKLRVRGLSDTAAGLPTAALADEILTPGDGQVRALFVVGGNPIGSWPNSAKTRRALESLELLVVVDPQVSATAQLAHYVFGPRFGFETPALSFGNEGISVYGLSFGYQEPYAQYQPQLIEPPSGSDVLEDWRLFYELGRAMGLALAYRGNPFDMQRAPSTDELLAHFVRRSRVPLEEIKRHPHGALFPDPQPLVEAPAAEWPYRLQLAAAPMMAELRELRGELQAASAANAAIVVANAVEPEAAPQELNLLLVSRRQHEVYNSVGHDVPELARRRPFNPAYLNPGDAERLGIRTGDRIEIRSDVGSIFASAQPEPELRSGVLSMAHCFTHAALTSSLVDDAQYSDPLSGMPRLSAVPVRVRAAPAPAA